MSPMSITITKAITIIVCGIGPYGSAAKIDVCKPNARIEYIDTHARSVSVPVIQAVERHGTLIDAVQTILTKPRHRLSASCMKHLIPFDILNSRIRRKLLGRGIGQVNGKSI